MERLSPTTGAVENEYLTYQKDGAQIGITLDTPAWQRWLEDANSFTFKCAEGSFTAHKTRASSGRGGWYWYAYRRQHGHLSNFYLGTTTKLTFPRLCEAARTLALSASEREPVQSTSPLVLADEFAIGPDSLLLSRLHIPRLSTQHVSRQRLLALLDQGIQRPLTIISAPAGSGKTTLLAEWAAATAYPLAWISLEVTDNDPLRFLSYLMAALASLDERIKVVYKPADAQNPERALTGILNDVTLRLQLEAVVILDDYHLLTSETVHALLGFLLDHLPPRLHLVIGTRVDPSLPLARLRARNQLNEVRTQDLRFLPDEVETLADAMGLVLSHEATDLLEQRAQGWIAGIQLLALALRGQADATTFLRTLRGSHRFLLDYVSEEVLAQQTPDTQHFLLWTSILERMTGPLCDAVTHLSDGQARLAQLLRANLFVSALDEAGIWYRYHPLFAETLRVQLEKLEPGLILELYLRASYWYEEHQGVEEAFEYSLLASDFPRAAHLLEEIMPQMIEQGRFEQLGRWLDQLPPALIASSPQLYIATPWIHSSRQKSPQYLEQALKGMELHVQKQEQNAGASWVEAKSILISFQAMTAFSRNNLPRAFALIRKALHTLTRRDTALSQLIARFLQLSLSIMYGSSGDLASAERILCDLSIRQPNEAFSLVNLAAPFLLGELYKAQGKLRKGEALYHDFVLMFESRPDIPALPLLVMAFLLMRKALVLYEWNRLTEAAEGIKQVLEVMPRAILEIIPRASQPALFAFGLWAQARIEWAQGRPEASGYFLELVRNQPEIMGVNASSKEQPPVDLSTLAARLALACGQIEEAFHWENICGLRFDDVPETLLEGRLVFAYFTLVRVLIVRGRQQGAGAALSQALILLEHWRGLAERLDFQGWLLEIQMLTALALHAQGNIRQALTTLGPMLAQAEVEGYVRLFVDEGQPMEHLLAHISAYTTASPCYIQRLQAALPSAPQALFAPARPAASQALLDPLSVREREVLSLLAAGLSNQQIADRLVISLNTAKRHVKNILAKLEVSNRTLAIVRARELHLL